ncbi:hypothetical protein BBJ28_00012078 [Nothophytophthora sp. Chile5]|nr:hypothetical protein BBJ28_00012078 [Nothophytophthora sp. Chile5]
MTHDPSQHRKRQRQGRDQRQWHQSRVFFAALAVVLVLCLGWTLWLVLLTVAPNEAINYVMRTKELDNGSFWLLVEPTPMLRGLGQFVLYQTLEAGFPLPLVTTCTVMIVLNALAVPALMYSPVPPSQLIEAFVDSTSDLLVAVGFPVVVLGYCLATFEYDRKSMRLTAELFNSWSFQCAARVQADPLQTAIIYKSLEGLRLQSVAVCLARIGNNLTLLFGLYRLMELLRRPQLSAAAPGPSRGYQRTAKTSIYPRKHPLAGLFVALALGTVIFVMESVRISQQACASQPLCVMHAHRWWLSRTSSGDFSSSSTSGPVQSGAYNCPCRVLIDVDLAPSTYSAWSDPPDATAAVEELAASGDLELLQLVNRRLPELPERLRHCTHLKHIALVFTHTTTLPSWAAEFTELQFLHIEGKSQALSLATLPQELFASMTHLTFIHLGVHPILRELPAFGGLTNLRSMTLVMMSELRQLPSDLTELHNLETFLLMMAPLVETVPDLSGMKESLKVLVIEPAAFCCNGFRGTDCDLSSAVCGTGWIQSDSIGEHLECLPTERQATPGTLEVFTTFETSVCMSRNPPSSPAQSANGSESANVDDSNNTVAEDSEAILERGILQCAGVQYRECKLEGMGSSGSGMCLSDRFTPISCTGSANDIELRRRQIAARVGPNCNPDYETWLGCTAS